MPKSTSVMNWSDNTEWTIPGFTKAPEYYYYTAAGFYTFDDFGQFGTPPVLNSTQMANITDDSYGWYGLTN